MNRLGWLVQLPSETEVAAATALTGRFYCAYRPTVEEVFPHLCLVASPNPLFFFRGVYHTSALSSKISPLITWPWFPQVSFEVANQLFHQTVDFPVMQNLDDCGVLLDNVPVDISSDIIPSLLFPFQVVEVRSLPE